MRLLVGSHTKCDEKGASAWCVCLRVFALRVRMEAKVLTVTVKESRCPMSWWHESGKQKLMFRLRVCQDATRFGGIQNLHLHLRLHTSSCAHADCLIFTCAQSVM